MLADARRRYAGLDFPAVARLCESFLEVDFTARLGDITAPTCVVVGEQDLLKGRRYAEILHRGIARSDPVSSSAERCAAMRSQSSAMPRSSRALTQCTSGVHSGCAGRR